MTNVPVLNGSERRLLVEVHTERNGVQRGAFSGGQEIWFGRDTGCDFVLDARSPSRRHFSVTLEGGAIVVKDDSSNGTRLGKRLLRREVARTTASWTEAKAGPYRITLHRHEPHGDQQDGGEARNAGAQGAELQGAPDDPPDEVPSGAPGGDEPHGSAPEVQAQGALQVTRQGRRQVDASLRRQIHAELLDHLDLAQLKIGAAPDAALRAQVWTALEGIVASHRRRLGAVALPEDLTAGLVADLVDEALGLGPLEDLLRDPRVSEIMVVDPSTIYVERAGRVELTDRAFTDDEAVQAAIERIVTPLGRRIDESTPLVDARLRDGSRVNAVIPPLATRGPCITIRKFPAKPLSLDDLVRFGSLTEPMAQLLTGCVRARKNLLLSGGTGSGKTTLLNVLSAAIPETERIVTIEDAAELRLEQRHVVSLEARPPNLEGNGEFTIRDLLKNALRMRPDRIVVGECRGGEALDMLQAMNTGHEGSMTTTHANSPRQAVARIETLCCMAGLDLPLPAIRRQIASSVHLIVQQCRLADGSRKVTSIAEITGLDEHGEVCVEELFVFRRTGTSAEGAILGEFCPTGRLPTFMDELLRHREPSR